MTIFDLKDYIDNLLIQSPEIGEEDVDGLVVRYTPGNELSEEEFMVTLIEM